MNYRNQARMAFGVLWVSALVAVLTGCGPVAPSIAKNGYAGGNAVNPGPSTDEVRNGGPGREFSNFMLRIVPVPAEVTEPAEDAIVLASDDERMQELKEKHRVLLELKAPGKPDTVDLQVRLSQQEIAEMKLQERVKVGLMTSDPNSMKWTFVVGKDADGSDNVARSVLENLETAVFVFAKEK